ncbi:chaperonin containing TCP1 gamma subunit [Cavenderia fasciculata]|uniref:T-complex protein 1 subunit gamma n=1 Tax=Cavenderia fasciculata TaxID=261658 RepID=F4PLA3_CACFS|nr:chaperonin containing TCP1 gamma subunit [Cavenderia fasciculata]EGG23325.1 chaperonin containing TCP1 gamma subunit [Cavenderia fasciculata]|eukprot:XP_004361176.1 chaperonin containing TCP1 gamma subunit [Cavenderia fasciculata]
MNTPVFVLNTNAKRENHKEAQKGIFMAVKAVASIIKTCMGPKAMLKMILDPMGTTVVTNDGNAILREMDVTHPAAKSIIELSRAQDENVGDGTTSVVILSAEVLSAAEPLIEKLIHPTQIIKAYKMALDDALQFMDQYSVQVDTKNRQELLKVIQSAIGTKFIARWSNLMCGLALDAVQTVHIREDDREEIDIKRYVRIEKIPGGDIADCRVLKGVLLNKDVTHAKMRRMIKNPRIILLDCALEYKKGESDTMVDITNEDDFARLLQIEEEYVERICNDIIKLKPDLVFTEKGVSDLAQHHFVKKGITCLRRLKKSENNRIARISGATIVSRTDELQEADVGTECGLFEIRKIGDEYFTFLEECKNPKACTVILRGASKDLLHEVDRNLQDAMSVARNILLDPRLVPGGGAIEMAISQALSNRSKSIEGIHQFPYKAVANALEVIPRVLSNNCGANTIKLLTELRAKHATNPTANYTWGVDGDKGVMVDMTQLGIWDTHSVKVQTLKTAIESACTMLRVDHIASAVFQTRWRSWSLKELNKKKIDPINKQKKKKRKKNKQNKTKNYYSKSHL